MLSVHMRLRAHPISQRHLCYSPHTHGGLIGCMSLRLAVEAFLIIIKTSESFPILLPSFDRTC